MSVQWKRRARGFAGALAPDFWLLVLELLVLTLLAFQIARLGWTVVTPVAPFGDWAPAGDSRPKVDLAVLGGFDPFFRQRSDDAAAVSGLSLTLLGTRVDMVSGRGSAIIAGADGVQASYLVGEAIVPGVTLKSVQFDGVTLDRGGTAEMLFLDQSAGGGPVAAVAPEALKPRLAADVPAPRLAADMPAPRLAADMPAPRLAADIVVTPRMKGSELTGYVLTPKGSGAAFAAAGLMAGDVLVRVDGQGVAAGDPAALAQRLDAGGVNVEVERGGKPVTIRIGR